MKVHSSMCRYRKFRMNDDVDLVVRCELDGVMNYKGQDQLLSIKALNEFDPKLTGAPCFMSATVHVSHHPCSQHPR